MIHRATIAPLVVIFSALATAPLRAQSTPPPLSNLSAEQADRDKSGDEPYDNPDLYGAKPFELGQGHKLPSVLIDYTVRSGRLLQRVSVFDNRVASIHLRGNGPDLHRRIQLSTDWIDTVEKLIASIDASSIHTTNDPFRRDNDRVEMRFNGVGGMQQIDFAAMQVMPQSIDTLRIMLGDLLGAIGEDKQVTNPITTYTPVAGDKLVGDDQHLYLIRRVFEDGSMVELEGVGKPIRFVVPAKLLYKLFSDVRPATHE